MEKVERTPRNTPRKTLEFMKKRSNRSLHMTYPK